MKSTTQKDNWSFELKQVFCRKTDSHGNRYELSAVITITDGIPHIELLSGSGDFSREDYRTIRKFVKSLGFNEAVHSKFSNGTQHIKEIK